MNKPPSSRYEYESAKFMCRHIKRLMTLQSHLRSLNSPGGKALEELAKKIGVSRRTIYRDLTTLQVMETELGGMLVIEKRTKK